MLFFSDNLIETELSSVIKSTVSSNKFIRLICLINHNTNLKCLVYDSKTNKFSDLIEFCNNCQVLASTLYVQFISDNQEYSAYCITNDKFIKFFRFDEYLNIKDMDSDNNECYSIFAIDSAECYLPFSSYLIHVNNDNKYYLVTTCSDEDNIDYVLKLTNIESCNTRIETSGFNVISEPVSEGEKTTATNAAPVLVESTKYSPIFSTPFSKEIDVSASFDVDFSSPLNNDNEIIINTNDLMMKDCPNMSKNKECIEECPPLDFFLKNVFLIVMILF